MANTLNLVRPELSDIKYNISKFPDGQPHIKFAPIDRKANMQVDIVTRICNPTDLFILLMAADVLHRDGILIGKLRITYLMGARMDRVMSFEEPMTLGIVADLINSIGANFVNIIEPHSYATFRLVNGQLTFYNDNLELPKILPRDAVIVYPDASAFERHDDASNANPIVTCTKHRDTDTGYIDSYTLNNPTLITADHPIFVIDDLCDGGRTFALCAKAIREIEPEAKLSIYVTHMVNPRGIDTLSQNYDKVYFTNSYKDWQNEELPDNVEVIEIV